MRHIDEAVFRRYPFNLSSRLAPDPRTALSIDLDALDRAVAALPPAQSRCLLARYEEHLADSEIASRLGISPDQAAGRIEAALDALRREDVLRTILVCLKPAASRRSAPEADGRSIDELGLSVRTSHCLQRSGIRTVGHLAGMTIDGLVRLRNVGGRTAGEVLQKLAEQEIFLKCEDPAVAADFPRRAFLFDGRGPETYSDYAARTKQADEELVGAIEQAERDGILAVTGRSDGMIEVDDFQLDKRMAYRIVPPDGRWYGEALKFASDKAFSMAGHLKSRLVSLLCSLDPDMTRTLDRIYLVADAADLDAVARMAEAEPCELPDCIEPDGDDGSIGCLWGAYDSIILDLAAIRRAADEACADAAADGAYLDPATEFDIGVYTTLTHEIYHLAAADPFRHVLEDSEDAAESYGRNAYERWSRGADVDAF